MTTANETTRPTTLAEADALVAAAEAAFEAARLAHAAECANPTPVAVWSDAPVYALAEALRAADHNRMVAHNVRARLAGSRRPF